MDFWMMLGRSRRLTRIFSDDLKFARDDLSEDPISKAEASLGGASL